MARNKTYSNETIRTAATAYYGGATLGRISKEMKIAVSTLSQWKNSSPVWAEAWDELEARARTARESLVEQQAEIFEDTAATLGRYSLDNLKGAVEIQKRALATIEGIQFPKHPKTMEDILALIRALSELTRMVDISWSNFALAMDLEAYLRQNQAPIEIEFEEYTPEEIEEIRRQN